MTETSRDNTSPNSNRDHAMDQEAPRSTAPSSKIEANANSEEAPSLLAAERSLGGPQSQGKVRKSSIRPAPADYRPNVRDPSTMRPMMVVRAGDAESGPATLESNIAEKGELTRPLPEARENENASVSSKKTASYVAVEPSALVIPPSPAVPIDLVPGSNRHERQARRAEPSAVAPALLTDSEVPPRRDPAHEREPKRADSATTAGSSISKRTSRSPWAIGLVCVALAVIALVMKHGTSERQPQARRAPSAAAPTTANSLAAPLHADGVQEPEGLTAGRAAAPGSASIGEVVASAAAAASAAPAPVASLPAPGTTRVRLELKPIDAKVYIRGREIPGPPYEFDIGKGQRVAVEVVRLGFATARVVLDDKKTVVSFGMLREKWKKGN